MNNTIRIDATDCDTYTGKATDFFLCHTPLIKDSQGNEVEYILQNEWPFVISQVLKFPDEASAAAFIHDKANINTPCLLVHNVVLRMSGALANVNAPHTPLSPQEVGTLIKNIFPKAAHWYKLVIMNKEKTATAIHPHQK